MKKILGLMVAALLVMMMVGGGTWAYFSDTETSNNNSITAGTLNLVPLVEGTETGEYVTIDVNAGGNNINGYVSFANAAPGDGGTITWTLSNDGSIPGKLTLASAFTFSDVDANDPETRVTVPHANNGGGDGDLDEFVGVKLQKGVGTDQTDALASLSYLLGSAGEFRPLSELEAELDGEVDVALTADGIGDDTVVYVLTWSIAGNIVILGDTPGGAVDDNIIQSDSAIIDIGFTLEQANTP